MILSAPQVQLVMTNRDFTCSDSSKYVDSNRRVTGKRKISPQGWLQLKELMKLSIPKNRQGWSDEYAQEEVWDNRRQGTIWDQLMVL